MSIFEGTFELKFKLGGSVTTGGAVPKYIGGFVKVVPKALFEQWGMMLIKSHVEEFGFKQWDEITVYSQSENGLKELVSDSDAWEMLHVDELPSVIEIWVVTTKVTEDGGETRSTAEEYTDESEGDDENFDSESDADEDFDGTDDDDDDDDQKYDANVDNTVEFGGIMHKSSNVFEKNEKVTEELPFMGSDDESLSDGDGTNKVHLPVFKAKRDLKNPHFSIGLLFPNKKIFKEAVSNYAFINGKCLKFTRNDSNRIYVSCVAGGEKRKKKASSTEESANNERVHKCPWKLRCHKVLGTSDFRITYFNDVHEACSWKYYNKMMNSTLLAKRWKREMKYHPNWKVKDFQMRVQTQEKCHLSYKQAWRALKVGYADDHGEAEDDYKIWWRYYEEIMRTNPGTSLRVKYLDDGTIRRFQRVYFCWQACREGFKRCRQIIGLDGCHMSGKFGATLLVANAIDGNENIFPYAYAIVEGENIESWTWFVDLLRLDLELNESNAASFTFMSDKQKGLLTAFEDVLPRAVHRFCVRHLEGNFKVAGFSGKALTDLLWEAARASTVSHFEEVMMQLKDEDADAYDWLVGKPASEWSRSHFGVIPKSDILTNNICESYNRVLKEARSQNLIQCLETIREMLMRRFFDLREKAENWKGVLCPTVAAKVAVHSKYAGGYIAIQSDTFMFQVRGHRAERFEQHVVDLAERTCTCNAWQLSGIPCAHSICAIWIQRQKYRLEVEDYVDEFYYVQTYKDVYKGSIKPIRGRSEWPDALRQPLFPPLLAPKPGRPKKKRKKSAGELTKDGKKLAGVFTTKRCGTCKATGHNKKTCPDDPEAVARQAKNKKKKRERKMLKRRSLRGDSNTVIQKEVAITYSTLPDVNEFSHEWWAEVSTAADMYSQTEQAADTNHQPPILADAMNNHSQTENIDQPPSTSKQGKRQAVKLPTIRKTVRLHGNVHNK